MSLGDLLFLQGFKHHQLHDVLEAPGTADLTTDVDFGAFKRAASSKGSLSSFPHHSQILYHSLSSPQLQDKVWEGPGNEGKQCLRSCVVGMILASFLPTGAGCFGPITQNEFLHKMGIRQRIDVSYPKNKGKGFLEHQQLSWALGTKLHVLLSPSYSSYVPLSPPTSCSSYILCSVSW